LGTPLFSVVYGHEKKAGSARPRPGRGRR